MSEASDNCNCGCPSPAVVSTPGTSGQSAFSLTTSAIIVPADNSNFAVSVGNSDWLTEGEILIVEGPAHFEVSVKNGLNLTLIFRRQPGDLALGQTIPSGSLIAPSGAQGEAAADPLPIANGGTGQITAPLALSALLSGAPLPIANGGTAGATKAAAQTALGLGQDSVSSTVTGLTQAVTNSAAQVSGNDVTIPAAGSYLILGQVSISITGVTYAASRTLTVKVRNVTQGTDVVSTVRLTGIYTTLTNASQEVNLPPFLYASGVANDHLQIMVSLDTVNSAGTYAVASASLSIIPLRKS